MDRWEADSTQLSHSAAAETTHGRATREDAGASGTCSPVDHDTVCSAYCAGRAAREVSISISKKKKKKPKEEDKEQKKKRKKKQRKKERTTNL